MDQRYWLVGLLFLAACSGGAAVSGAGRVAGPAAAKRNLTVPAVAQAEREPVRVQPAEPTAPLDYENEADNDQAYLDNTKRAIELYRQFIERAGTDPEYATAVKRSREQIEDLTKASVWVSEGMRARGSK